jgi:hypothetical protein
VLLHPRGQFTADYAASITQRYARHNPMHRSLLSTVSVQFVEAVRF